MTSQAPYPPDARSADEKGDWRSKVWVHLATSEVIIQPYGLDAKPFTTHVASAFARNAVVAALCRPPIASGWIPSEGP